MALTLAEMRTQVRSVVDIDSTDIDDNDVGYDDWSRV